MEKELIEAMREMSKEMDKMMNGSQENVENRQELFNLEIGRASCRERV